MKKIKVERGKVKDSKMEDSKVGVEENEIKERSIWRLWLCIRNYLYFSYKCDQILIKNIFQLQLLALRHLLITSHKSAFLKDKIDSGKR